MEAAAWAPSNCTVAPIWGAPEELRTMPEMVPNRVCPQSEAAVARRSTGRHPSFRFIAFYSAKTRFPCGTYPLFHGKVSCGRNRLLGNIVAYFNGQPVAAGGQRTQRHALLERNLLAHIPHLFRLLHRVDHRFIGRRVYNVVLNCCRGLLTLLINTQVVYLHPEVRLLVALKADGLSVRARYPRANFSGSNHEISRAHVLGRYLFHLVGHNQGG